MSSTLPGQSLAPPLPRLSAIAEAVLSGFRRHALLYAFAAFVFFFCCLAMSIAGSRVEKRLNAGVR